MPKVTFTMQWPFSGKEFRELLVFAFQVSLVSFVGFFLIESLRTGFISHYFRIHYLLWAVVATGIATAIWPLVVSDTHIENVSLVRKYVLTGLVAMMTMLLVWQKISAIGSWSFVLAILSGLMVLGLSLLIFSENEK